MITIAANFNISLTIYERRLRRTQMGEVVPLRLLPPIVHVHDRITTSVNSNLLSSSTGIAWEIANKPKITAIAKYFIVVQR
jgi:hypothetical protein